MSKIATATMVKLVPINMDTLEQIVASAPEPLALQHVLNCPNCLEVLREVCAKHIAALGYSKESTVKPDAN